MIRWRFTSVALVLFLSIPQHSVAEPISVISGEHESFTRLVLELPESVDWEISTETGKSTLTLIGFDDGFDLTQAFSIIPRTRLKALVARDSALELQLACACPIQSYVEQGRFLVLDIADGSPLETAPKPAANSQEVPTSTFGVGDLLWSKNGIAADASPITDPASPKEPGRDQIATDTRISEAVSETREQLLKAFSVAASRDIISLNSEIDIQATTETADSAEPEVFDSSNLEIVETQDSRSNLRITSSRDLPSAAAQITDLNGATCPRADIVDISTWSESNEFNTILANSNANLFDDAGRLRPEEVLQRTKVYIFFGFGAEAMQVLSLQENLQLAHPELVDLASILENGFAPNPRYLHQFPDCDSDLALWGILAAETVSPDMVINAEAALRALKKLPTHLQYYLAEALANRLAQLGDTEKARIAVSIFENLEENSSEELLLVSAEIEKKVEGSHEILSDLSAKNHSQTPEAVARLIDHHIENDIPVSADIALLAEAFATEMRASDDANIALRAFVLAAIKSSQFEKAYKALNDPRIRELGSLERELVSNYFTEIAIVSADADFLDSVFRQLPQKLDFLEPIVLAGIAGRLLELGFTSQAKEIMGLISDKSQKQKYPLLYAKIEFHENDFVNTLGLLEGLNGQEVELLRGKALQALQEPERAALAFRSAENETLATSALWLSDQWQEYFTSDDLLYGRIREIASSEREEVSFTSNMLAQSQEQIEASVAAREVLEELLQDLLLPD